MHSSPVSCLQSHILRFILCSAAQGSLTCTSDSLLNPPPTNHILDKAESQCGIHGLLPSGPDLFHKLPCLLSKPLPVFAALNCFPFYPTPLGLNIRTSPKIKYKNSNKEGNCVLLASLSFTQKKKTSCHCYQVPQGSRRMAGRTQNNWQGGNRARLCKKAEQARGSPVNHSRGPAGNSLAAQG